MLKQVLFTSCGCRSCLHNRRTFVVLVQSGHRASWGESNNVHISEPRKFLCICTSRYVLFLAIVTKCNWALFWC